MRSASPLHREASKPRSRRGFSPRGVQAVETALTAETPDKRSYRNSDTFFFEFEDDRIAEIRKHVDTRYAADFFS